MEKACLLLPLKLNYCMTGHALLWNGPGFPDQKDPMQEHAGPKASKVVQKAMEPQELAEIISAVPQYNWLKAQKPR